MATAETNNTKNTNTKYDSPNRLLVAFFGAIACAAILVGGAFALDLPIANKAAAVLDIPWISTQTSGPNDHYEGQEVTIYAEYGDPVYAEWHRGGSGRWWATFYTDNGTKMFARMDSTNAYWQFFAAVDDDMPQAIRFNGESTQFGQYGPEGLPSHWRDLYDENVWY